MSAPFGSYATPSHHFATQMAGHLNAVGTIPKHDCVGKRHWGNLERDIAFIHNEHFLGQMSASVIIHRSAASQLRDSRSRGTADELIRLRTDVNIKKGNLHKMPYRPVYEHNTIYTPPSSNIRITHERTWIPVFVSFCAIWAFDFELKAALGRQRRFEHGYPRQNNCLLRLCLCN